MPIELRLLATIDLGHFTSYRAVWIWVFIALDAGQVCSIAPGCKTLEDFLEMGAIVERDSDNRSLASTSASDNNMLRCVRYRGQHSE